MPIPLDLPDADATTAFGRRIAPHLGVGDVVLLSGPLGAGKTHLARAIIQARLAATGGIEEVPSPTYTLVQTYSAGDLEIWHADLYRLDAPGAVYELGLAEAFDGALTLIEWPDRLGALAPRDGLMLHLAPRGAGRRLTAAADAARWEGLLDRLAECEAAPG